jgi:hypothetical protein
MKRGDWLLFDDCGKLRAGKIVRSPKPDHYTLRVITHGQERRIYKAQVKLHGEALAREIIRLKEEKTA